MPIPFYISDDKTSLLLEFSGQRQFISAEDALALANRIIRAFSYNPERKYLIASERDAAIKKDYDSGIKIKDIVAKFDINQSHIYRILKNAGYTPKRQDVSKRIKILRGKQA